MTDNWITVKEAAGILRRSQSWVLFLCNEEKPRLKVKKLGRDWRVWKPSAQAFKHKRRGRPSENGKATARS